MYIKRENMYNVPTSKSGVESASAGNNREVEAAAVDFNDSSVISQVLKNAEVVFWNLPSTSFNPSEPIIKATKKIATIAKANGVKLLMFNTSMPVPEVLQGIKAQDDRREMRKILRAEGLPVISIQPVVYLDNLLEGWALPPIRDHNTVVYCHKPDLDIS